MNILKAERQESRNGSMKVKLADIPFLLPNFQKKKCEKFKSNSNSSMKNL